MSSSADFTYIDCFEKIRGYLLESDPTLEATAFARPADPSGWAHLPPTEYHEILLAILLDFDRRSAAGRRAIRLHLQALHDKMGNAGQVSDAARRAPRRELFQFNRRERWLRENDSVVASAMKRLMPEREGGPLPLIGQLQSAKGLPEVAATVRKSIPFLGHRRAYEFLAQIGYPIVVPDFSRQRLLQRLGWATGTVAATKLPQEFFETCDRLEHLTGEPLPVINAVLGFFSGALRARAGETSDIAVCISHPQCGQCVVSGHCAYYRYRGEPEPASNRTIKRMAFAEQPRTRFESVGPFNLSEVELLALIIRTGAEGKSSLDLSREILEKFGSLEGLANAGLGELCSIKGIGRAKAIEIRAALELGRRLIGGPVAVGEQIKSSADVHRAFLGLLGHDQQENFYLVVLNTRNRVQSHFLISRGSLTGSFVHPREVMKVAIREAAASVIFVHNHPSGDPEPSQDDLDITERLCGAARLVGIRVLDHVIVGRDNFFSFADHQLLDPRSSRP